MSRSPCIFLCFRGIMHFHLLLMILGKRDYTGIWGSRPCLAAMRKLLCPVRHSFFDHPAIGRTTPVATGCHGERILRVTPGAGYTVIFPLLGEKDGIHRDCTLLYGGGPLLQTVIEPDTVQFTSQFLRVGTVSIGVHKKGIV